MQFNSVEFFIFFITVLILINCLKKSHYQQAILLGASYFFYWTTSNYFVLLLLFITVISYQSGEAIYQASNQARKKTLLAIALISLLIPLAFFKYYNFGIEIINQITIITISNSSFNIPFLDLILPIGISFYTFSAISYVVDIYTGTIQLEKNFYKYALFVSYFPHLLSGPIVRGAQFLPQLKNHIALSPKNLKIGVSIMLWGFVKKFVIADNCAPIVNAIFIHPTEFNSLYIIIGTLLFGIQIYCDFSGYIDIALGAAELIGLHLPQNFFRPYLSKNPTEFWRRWNITLSSFIRDYVYIPLGGNRKGTIRTYFNLEFSMLLCGLWHGAGWHFIIWGGYHGILLSVHKIIAPQIGLFPKIIPFLNDHFRLFGKILITQYFIFLGWIMFRVGNPSDMIYCMNKYVFIDFNSSKFIPIKQPLFDAIMNIIIQCSSYIKIFFFIVVVVVIIFILQSDYWMKKTICILTTDWPRFISYLPLKYWVLSLTMMIFILLCFTASANPEFIYFQF